VKRPELRRRDRAVWAAASGLLPRERWPVFVVSPQTLLRWQRELGAQEVDVIGGGMRVGRRSTMS